MGPVSEGGGLSRSGTARSTPRRRQGLPPRRSSGPAGQSAGSRGGHVVDVALLFAELARVPGVTQAELGRRYRKSPGYVSVVCRLGRALHGLPPETRDVLRVSHFTLKAAQGLVGRYPDPEALQGAALRLARTAPAARVRARVGVPGDWHAAPVGPDVIDPLPEPADALAHRDTFAYAWDAELARRDPAAALAAFEAYVRTTTDEVVRRLRRAAGDSGPITTRPTWAAGPPGVPAPTAGRGAADDASIRLLQERVRDTLRAHRARMQEFLTERARSLERRAAGRGGSLQPLAVDPGDLEADLA